MVKASLETKKKCYDHYKNENGIEWIDRRINECREVAENPNGKEVSKEIFG